MEKINVLIVDDQDLFVAGTRIIIEAYGKGRIKVSATAGNGKEAIDAVKREIPDVILMDVRMPVMDGVEATKLIHEAFPEIKILILTTFEKHQTGRAGYFDFCRSGRYFLRFSLSGIQIGPTGPGQCSDE